MQARSLAALLAVLMFPAAAAAQEIATVENVVPISAHHGWVVWSAKDGALYSLFEWRHGRTTELPIAGRKRPFDVDVGTDAGGRDVVTFSRCDGFGSIEVWAARVIGRACRLRIVDLVTGRERGAGVPERAGESDTLPSMWRGRVAFARRQPKLHGDVDQVVLWDRAGGVRTLRHGAVPSRCPYRRQSDCDTAPPSGEVLGLDLGARLVAFSWKVNAPAVIGHGGYEVRADRLSDGRTALVGAGYIGEACTGPGPDGSAPAAPIVDGDRVWYSQTATSCYDVTAALAGYRAFPVRGRSAALDGTVFQAVKDGSSVDELVAPPNASNEPPACTPCSIRRIAAPPLKADARRPTEPFE
jgi:hypothetical protein